MTMEEAAPLMGWNLEETLRRVSGNRALLARFVRKFPQDPTFGKLEQAVAAGSAPEIEAAAHALKGIAGNLGFQELFRASAAMVDAVRAGKTEQLAPLWEAVQAGYRAVAAGIEQIEW